MYITTPAAAVQAPALTAPGPVVNLEKSMVNKNPAKRDGLSTRAYVLGELRREPGAWVHGEALAGALGLSRVAVWKGVRSLVAAGYPVVSGESGYRLAAGETDFLYPWEFGEREGLFRFFGSTGSTMDRAREYAEGPGDTMRAAMEAGAPMVFAAETQSAGRGRGGRDWASGPGGLFFTVLERPGLALADYPLCSMGAQIAAARTVAALTGREARLRWPNDVYADGKKIAGVLTELSGEGDRIRWIAVGVGINVNNLPAMPSGRAVSCAELAGRRLSRREGLSLFLGELEKLRGSGPGELRDAWNSLAGGIGAPVIVAPPGHGGEKDPRRAMLRGIFGGVDRRGRCRIRPEAGPGSAGQSGTGPQGAVRRAYAPGTASLIYRQDLP
jgi:BirA family biotin operon repressor/biotin-[acetyl-CoA-carboxylase] ligase